MVPDLETKFVSVLKIRGLPVTGHERANGAERTLKFPAELTVFAKEQDFWRGGCHREE